MTPRGDLTNVGDTALSTALVSRELSHDAESMRQLRLPASILSVDLVDALRLEATGEHSIPLLTAC